MTTLIRALTLAAPALAAVPGAALQDELEPLREERQLEDRELVAREFARLEVDGAGAVGWTRTTVERAQLGGEPHVFVHRTAELIDFEALCFLAIESRGLYDADLRLVHELRREQPFGADTKPLELEWADGELRWREGRGRWSDGKDGPRPTVETDVALFVHGLALPTPWEGQIFDDETRTIEVRTVQAGEQSTVDGRTVTTFDVEGATPGRHRVRDDGVLLESQIGELQIVGVHDEEDPGITLRQAVADNAVFESTLDGALPARWSETKGTFTHPAIEMSLELPKGWTRAPASEVDGTTFHALSADGNAYMSIATTALGTGYTLEGWSEGLLEFYTEAAVDGEVKTKSGTFARQDAIRFEFVRAGDAPLDSTAHAWERNGFGFLVIGGTWSDAPKKLHRETRSALKSVEVAR